MVTDRGHANLVASDDLAPEPQDTAVEFRDLRFAYSVPLPAEAEPPPALIAWVYVTPTGAIDAMVMNGRAAKMSRLMHHGKVSVVEGRRAARSHAKRASA